MQLDDQQAVDEGFHVLHPVQPNEQRQAGPVDAAHAVGKRGEDAVRDHVVVRGLRGLFALPGDTGGGI